MLAIVTEQLVDGEGADADESNIHIGTDDNVITVGLEPSLPTPLDLQQKTNTM